MALTLRIRPVATVAILIAAAVVTPVVAIVAALASPETEVWSHLWRTRLPRSLLTTVGFVSAVTFGATVLGTALAWLLHAYRFPLSRVLGALLVLPLALPVYVLAFVSVDILDAAGPVGGALGEPRSFGWAVVVFILALYPYVYLLARAGFRDQPASLVDAASALGDGRARAFIRVVVPVARPAIAAGAVLVALETLTDFAAVRVLGQETVADAVFRVWFGLQNRDAASELAVLLLVLALALIAVERFTRRGRVAYPRPATAPEPMRLTGSRAWAATLVCSAVVVVAFFAPVARLVTESGSTITRGATTTVSGSFAEHTTNTILLAGLVALCCIIVAFVLASGTRLQRSRIVRAFTATALSGYAIPGAVLAIGVLLVLASLDRSGWGGPVLIGTLLSLVAALTIRLVAVAFQSADSNLEGASPNVTDAARSLGSSDLAIAARVHAPMIRTGLLVGAALVFLDALKELPATLLLRPFGFDTLAVRIWEATSESRWDLAALPALAIVALGIVPVVLLARRRLDLEPRRST